MATKQELKEQYGAPLPADHGSFEEYSAAKQAWKEENEEKYEEILAAPHKENE